MDLDPKLLRVFLAVLHNGSVTRAAEALNLSQPSVSKSLRRLQSVVGFALFEPRGRSIHPTSEAQLLREAALRVERELEAVRHRVIQIRQGRRGGFRIGAIPAIATTLLPRAIVEFRRQRPETLVEVELWRRERIVSEFDSHRIEIGLIYSATPDAPSGFRILANAPLKCLLPVGHHLCAMDVVTAEDLKRERMVIYHHSLDFTDALWHLIEGLTPMPNIVVEASQAAFLRDLVRRGIGISLIDGFTAADETLADMTSRPFHPELPFYIAAADRGAGMSADARAFLKIVADLC